jgi:hypothetical protein
MRSTAEPASSEAVRSTTALMPQSWSAAGSSRICRTAQLPGFCSMISNPGPRASDPVPISS